MPDTNTPGSTSVDKNKQQQQQSAGRMGTNPQTQGADKNRPNPQEANRQDTGGQRADDKDQAKKTPSSY
jgi:hypothetical protein